MQYEWRLHLDRTPGRVGLAVTIYRDLPNGSIEVMDGGDTITTYAPTVPVKPTLYLPDDSMLQLFVDAAAKRGMKHQGGYTDGELEATKKHLEDMRTLVLDHGKQ